MLIEKIELENIKKYDARTVELKEGINFISGKNGAGKTTLIESIGFALFDFQISPKNFSDYFVRKGKKKGSVRVYFRDKHGEMLIADRKIGKSTAYNSWSIRKIEEGVELAVVSGNAEVREFIRQNIEFYEDDDITSVYKNVVSVPQGEFTFAFMQPEAVRKTIFDPIFKLEGFKQAYSNVKIEKGLEEEIGKISEQIAEKRGASAELSDIKKDLKQKQEEEKGLIETLDGLEKNHLKEGTVLKELEQLTETFRNKKSELDKIQEIVQYKQNEQQIAKDSREKMASLQSAYESYKQTEKEIEELSIKLTEVEGKRRELEEVGHRIEKGNLTVEAENKNLAITLESLEKAERQIGLAKEKIKKQAGGVNVTDSVDVEALYEEVTEKIVELERYKSEILRLLRETMDTKEASLLKDASGKIREVEEESSSVNKAKLKVAGENIDKVITLRQNQEVAKKEELEMLIVRRDQITEGLAKLYKKHVDREAEESDLEIREIQRGFKALQEAHSTQVIAKTSSQMVANEIERQIALDEEEKQKCVVRCEKIKADIKRYEDALLNLKKQFEGGKDVFIEYTKLQRQMELKKNGQKMKKEAYETFIAYSKKAEDSVRLDGEVLNLLKAKEHLLVEIKELEERVRCFTSENHITDYEDFKEKLQRKETEMAVYKQNIQFKQNELKILTEKVRLMNALQEEIKEAQEKIETFKKVIQVVKKMKNVLKNAPIEIADLLIRNISDQASEIYSEIATDGSVLEWKNSYELVLHGYENGEDMEKEFKQLSGGEQMTAALAIRIAMIELITKLRLCILDEPTINLDSDRREKLSMIIQNASRHFRQLIVVSHDDTFEAITQNRIELS